LVIATGLPALAQHEAADVETEMVRFITSLPEVAQGSAEMPDYALERAAKDLLAVGDIEGAVSTLTRIDALKVKQKPANFHAVVIAIDTKNPDIQERFAQRWLDTHPWDVYTPGLVLRLAHWLERRRGGSAADRARRSLDLARMMLDKHPDLVRSADAMKAASLEDSTAVQKGQPMPAHLRTPLTAELLGVELRRYQYLGETDKAVALAHRLIGSYPDHPSAASYVSMVHRRSRGDRRIAIDALSTTDVVASSHWDAATLTLDMDLRPAQFYSTRLMRPTLMATGQIPLVVLRDMDGFQVRIDIPPLGPKDEQRGVHTLGVHRAGSAPGVVVGGTENVWAGNPHKDAHLSVTFDMPDSSPAATMALHCLGAPDLNCDGVVDAEDLRRAVQSVVQGDGLVSTRPLVGTEAFDVLLRFMEVWEPAMRSSPPEARN